MPTSIDKRRAPYSGKLRRLVVAMDVGTTFSGAAWAVLDPGRVPEIKSMMGWQNQAASDAKVSSAIFYDRQGRACAFGAETEDEEVLERFEEEHWHEAKWWKLHLRPSHLPIIKDLKLPSLPPNVTVDDLFVDFLRYMIKQVRAYIEPKYADGKELWETLSPSMYIILTTPNGWEGVQQNRMRSAAIKAGIVDQDGGARIKFVTEAEAAINYAADSGNIDDWLVKNSHLIVGDLGGGTGDFTCYAVKSTKPLRLEESSAAQCCLAGGEFVSQAFKKYLEGKLCGTEWAKPEILKEAVSHFDKHAKRTFVDLKVTSTIKLGTSPNSDASRNIRCSRLKISGETMASFFAPSLELIKQSLEDVWINDNKIADKIILVGGLASSPYVYNELVEWGKEFGIPVSRPDGPVVKAVPYGAIAWHIDDTVSSRVSKCHYGTDMHIPYDKTNNAHKGHHPWTDLEGELRVDHAWSGIVAKDIKIKQGKEFFSTYVLSQEITASPIYETKIYVYRGTQAKPPEFVTFPGKSMLVPGFEVICKVRADLTACLNAHPVLRSKHNGKEYKKVEFKIGIALGETEITARMHWKENGVAKKGPATLAYD